MTTINPGYRAITGKESFRSRVGVMLRCPKCKRPICEGEIDTIYIRCKGCGHWVYLKRVDTE